MYVFERDGRAQWTQEAYVTASNIAGGFGWSVAVSGDGNTLAVSGARAVFVFEREDETWVQEAHVKASNTETRVDGDHFGHKVALSGDGNTLAVSAIGEASNATGIDGNQADNSTEDAGAVYVFVRAPHWTQRAYVKASNTEAGGVFAPIAGDGFGRGVALSGDGNTLAVGAPYEDSNATGINGNQADNSMINAGAVYLY